MTYHPVEPQSDAWDAFVRSHARGHLLQLSAWGTLKSEFGWAAIRAGITDDADKLVAGAQILLRRLPFRLGMLAYIPYGPLVDWEDAAQVAATLKAIDTTARKHGARFLKIEPGRGILPDDLRKAGFKPSPQTVQPPATIIIDLDEADAMLKRMNQGTRRNIRKADKFEVTVREGVRDDVDSFNAMLE